VGVSSTDEPRAGDVLSSLPRTRPQRRSAKRDTGAPSAGGAAKPRATAAKPKATAKPKPTPKSPPKAATKPKPRPGPQPAAKAGPAPSAAAAPKRPPAAATEPPRSVEPPSRTDVVAGAVQAATELAQAGLAVGNELLRAALSRLPRP
jgi:hypothetical protein